MLSPLRAGFAGTSSRFARTYPLASFKCDRNVTEKLDKYSLGRKMKKRQLIGLSKCAKYHVVANACGANGIGRGFL